MEARAMAWALDRTLFKSSSQSICHTLKAALVRAVTNGSREYFRNTSLVLLAVCVLIPWHPAAATSNPSRILVVYKSNSADADGNGVPDSLQLANYYAAKRGVPSANLLGLNISVGSAYGIGQYGTFYSEMVVPIENALAALGRTNIDIILLAGELPTLVYDGSNTPFSVDSCLMAINSLGSAPNSAISKGSNPYFDPAPGFDTPPGHFTHAQYQYNGTTMYLVTRLGSDSNLRGIAQVDQSVYADLYLYPQPGYFYGNAYVDSQFGQPGTGLPYTDAFLSAQPAVQLGLYDNDSDADMDIAYAEHYITPSGFPLKWEYTGVSIGDPGATFSDGTSALTAPRALFYGGWYNFDKYNNVYEWLPGSVASDLNSGSYFAIQALDHGASAASYVVSEPYLNGAPRPNILYYYLLAGYEFAEASALATPYIPWEGINEGDPLYAPMQAKTPIFDTQFPVLSPGVPAITANPATNTAVMTLQVMDTPKPEVVTAKVVYGTNTTYGSVSTSQSGFSLAPTVSLAWTAGQVYHYKVTLTDPAGNTTTTGDLVFDPNAPPWVVNAASATPNPVTVTTTTLSALGADESGESNLTYTWSATGPAPVTFSGNGANASKNTSATFSKVGSYNFQVLITNPMGLTVASTVTVVVNPNSLPPSIPGNVTATALSSSQINVSWAASTDTSGVAGYQVFRNGVQIGTTTALSYSDTGLAASTTYYFTVAAFDAAGNVSNQSTAASATTTAPGTFPPPPTQGLIGYWKFDEGSGSIARDSSGSGYNGTVNGATWTTGKINSALNFNGTTSDVVTPSIPLGSTFSASTWVNPAITNEGAYSRILETQYNGGLYLGTNGSGLNYKFMVSTGHGTTGSCGAAYGCAEGGAISSGWHLVTATYDGTTAILYVDGAVVASDTFSTPESTSFPLYVGRYYAGNGNGWNGAIDEVRLYNRALTSSEVTNIYNYTGGPSDTTPPSIPANVTATAVSTSQINVAWTASTDNVEVAGYQVFRNGVEVGTTTALSYSDTGLAASTTYSYTVAAFDAAGNVSNQSTAASATTLAPVHHRHRV